MFLIPTPPALVAQAQPPKLTPIVPQTLAISKLIALAHPRHLPILSNAERKLFVAAIVDVNRQIGELLGSNVPDSEKKLKLVQLQQKPLEKLKTKVGAKDFKKLLQKMDKLTKNEVLEHVKRYPLSVGDDPFGKTNRLIDGDDPFEFIGETEKNLRRSEPLGGNMLLVELAKGLGY